MPGFGTLKNFQIRVTDDTRTGTALQEMPRLCLALADRHLNQVNFDKLLLHRAFAVAIPHDDAVQREYGEVFGTMSRTFPPFSKRPADSVLDGGWPTRRCAHSAQSCTRRQLPSQSAFFAFPPTLRRTTADTWARSCSSSTSMAGTFLLSSIYNLRK